MVLCVVGADVSSESHRSRARSKCALSLAPLRIDPIHARQRGFVEAQVKRLTRAHQTLILAFAAMAISMTLLVDPVAAHQPIIVPPTTNSIDVADPTISKAYYAELKGQPDTYHIASDTPFSLSLNVLVPAISGVTEDYTLTIIKDGTTWVAIAPGAEAWKVFDEPFGGNRYLRGPQYRQGVPAGRYDVVVSSPDNVGKYVLSVGEVEVQSTSTPMTIAALKQYFKEPAIAVLDSPLGYSVGDRANDLEAILKTTPDKQTTVNSPICAATSICFGFISIPRVAILLTIVAVTSLILLVRRRRLKRTQTVA